MRKHHLLFLCALLGAQWPYDKPSKKPMPQVRLQDRVRNPIDAFILAKLEEKGIAPAAPAEKRVLARRVYYDLIGLPPTPGELDSFLSDSSPNAYEKLVDKLLADPRYGERWGRHWLDLVRYGETSGLEGDGAIGNAWRYRDWVIDAFNADMPYDRFVYLQLAGADEHSKTRNNYAPDPQGQIPLGFLRVAPWDRSNLVAAEVRNNYLSEVTTATGSIFLGMSIGCARCHDHKYDPIPQKDFYRMQAFFNAVQVENVDVPYNDKKFAALANEKIKALQERIKSGEEKRALEALEKSLLPKIVAKKIELSKTKKIDRSDLRLELRRANGLFSEAEKSRYEEARENADRTLDTDERKILDSIEAPMLAKLVQANPDPALRFQTLTVADVASELRNVSEQERARHAELSEKLEVLRHRLSRWQPNVLTVKNVPGPPNGPAIAAIRVLTRGDYRYPGEAVEPAFPTAFTGESKPAEIEFDRYRQFPTRGLRSTLAHWIANNDNPLTARVMVNRIWQHHFGRGIVATASDFGRNGDKPTHPELLDWLAVEFMEQGWSVKSMHRLMLLSNTYRQSSENGEVEADPENKLLWRFPRRRLEAEEIRDSILQASGRLNPAMKGPSVFPPLPGDLADFARYGRGGGIMWEPNEKDEDARRRSVYTFQRRSLPLPLMAAFDATVFSESCERRGVTTTPLQALSMMNGDLVHDEAKQLARRLEGGDRASQVRRAFELVLSRPARNDEIERFSKFEGSLESLCRVLLNSNEFLYID
jgi:hypothetical protein